MENLDKNRVPKVWLGREVVVRTRGPAGEVKEMFGKLEDAHEGGVVLSGVGPTRTEAEPVMFYPWSAIEALRLQVPSTDLPGPHEESRDHARAAGRSRHLPPPTEPKLMKVVPIAQRSSTARITITLRSLEIYEGGHGLIGYLVSHAPGAEKHRPPWHSFPEEVRVSDDRGRSYEAAVRNVHRASGGELWVADLPEADAAELEVEVVRLFEGPPGLPGRQRGEALDGPWVFRFPL